MGSEKNIAMIVFDMAGTTVDEGKIVYSSIQQALGSFDVTYPLEEVYAQVGGMNKKEGIRKLIKLSSVPVSEDLVDRATAAFLETVEERYRNDPAVREMPGAGRLFRTLRNAGVRVVLDTGYFRRTADILIDKLGWREDGLIDYSVTSDEVEQGRPAPLMIRKAMEYFDMSEPKCVAKVGDTPADMQEGINAGCGMCIGMVSRADAARKRELEQAGADEVIDSLGLIPGIIGL